MADAYRSSMLILSTTRCANRCKFCAYHMDAPHITAETPSVKALATQTRKFYNAARDAIDKTREIYVVNSGSFFDERQIPKGYHEWLAGFLNNKGLDLVVETRADSGLERNVKSIEALRAVTGSMTIAMGLEAYRPDLGDKSFQLLAKGIRAEQLVKQSEWIHAHGCGVKAYMIIALPWMPSPSLEEGYRKMMDWHIETAFLTAKFALEEMKADILGVSPFFPYRGTNARIPEGHPPISVTEAAEVAHQLRQLFPEKRFDYTSRQVHLKHGDFFHRLGLPTPFNARDEAQVRAVRENVAAICERTLGTRGKISEQFVKGEKSKR